MSAFKAADGETRTMFMADKLGAPEALLPLTRREAIDRARELHELGFDWPAVALAMGYYHGWYLTQGAWRQSVDKWCGTVKRPRGVPFSNPRVAA